MYRDLKKLELKVMENPEDIALKKEFLYQHAKVNRFIKSLNRKITKRELKRFPRYIQM